MLDLKQDPDQAPDMDPSNVNDIETKAEQSFDIGLVFNIEAKQTCLFQNLQRSKRSQPC
jgi:hypothetical protein